MHLSAVAWRHRIAAAGCLAGERWVEALRHAREANRLQRTEAGDGLLLVALLLAR
jgi:hypothetical protein